MNSTSAAPPRTSLWGEDVVCLSSIDWDFLWQAHQEIMRRLAADGNPVLFIENTGVRSPNLSDLPRLLRRLANWWGGTQGFHERAPNLIVLSPLLLPFPYSRLCRWVNSRLLGRSISRWVGATKRGSPILWTFLPTPIVHDLIERLGPSLVIYYCADNLAASSPGAEAVAESERRLFARADLVFTTSRAIQRRAGSEAHYFPPAIDYAKFERRRLNPGREPEDLARIPHPRIGYVGGLHRWVDFALLRQAALARPGIHFVCVGPEQADAAALKGLPNVHLLGPRPHDALPAYIAAFDCALIPYRLTEFTESVYPVKLNEYLAMGVPVVSTALPEVAAYNEEHGGVVRVLRSGDELAPELDAALDEGALRREARVAAARRNGWDERVSKMTELLEARLAENRASPAVVTGIIGRLADGGRRWTFAAVLSLLVVAALRLTPLGWLAAEPLRRADPPAAADAVIVLAGGAGETGRNGQGYEERISRAIQVYHAKSAPKIYIASGESLAFTEQHLMRTIALAHGVPDSDILLGPQAGSSRRMVAEAAKTAASMGWARVILVSSPYHMRRATILWRRHRPGTEVLAAPSNSRFYGGHSARPPERPSSGPTFIQLKALAQEYVTLAYYRLRGWL